METPRTLIRAKGLQSLNFDEQRSCVNPDSFDNPEELGVGWPRTEKSRKEKEI